MVTRYDVVSSRWSSHFWVKMYDFQLFSGIKVKFVDKMMQSKYLCVTLRVERKKKNYSHCSHKIGILTRWRPCLVTSQTSSSATTRKIYLIL